MKFRAVMLIFSLALLTNSSCRKSRPESATTGTATADFMIVGKVGGFIMYSAPFYKLSGSQLVEDSTKYNINEVPDDPGNFNFNYLQPQARLDTVKYLLSSVPAELFNYDKNHIGAICPDFGYTDVRVSVNGALYRWYFECDLSKSSPQVQDFVQRLRQDF